MTSIYTADAVEVDAEFREAGGPVTFPGAIPGTAGAYDPVTDTFGAGTPATDAASYAIQPEGDPDTYRALSLILSNPVTLNVAAYRLTAVSVTLRPGMLFVWASVAYTIRTAEPFGPDGTAIYYTVVGSA